MTLFVDKLHREKRKDGRRGKETLLSLLPPFPSSLSTYPSLSQLCSAVPTFICCHSYRGAVHFSAPIWFAAQPVTHPPSSPYDWGPLLAQPGHPISQSRATFKAPPLWVNPSSFYLSLLSVWAAHGGSIYGVWPGVVDLFLPDRI